MLMVAILSQTYKYNTDRQLRDAKIGKWKNQITDDDIKYIEKDLMNLK